MHWDPPPMAQIRKCQWEFRNPVPELQTWWHSTRLSTTFKRHLQQMKAVMKSIWTGEPNEKRGQRDFVLRQREQRHTEARVPRAF
jgi:hypothetical protein